jgi:ribonuclease D
MPVKGGEPYKEVKEIQAAEKPEAKRAKALTGLRKVEAETKARNEARAAEAAAKPKEKPVDSRIKELLKEFASNKKIVEENNVSTDGAKDRLVMVRHYIMQRREQLRESKHKDLYEILKDNEIMTWKLPRIATRKTKPVDDKPKD